MREIGSEFWSKYEPADAERTNETVYLLSGRTALRFIIDDICKTRTVKKALLPSYCCESMIEPFARLGFEVEFYHVFPDHFDYPFENDADIVLLVDFFGYVIEQNTDIACCENRAGKIVIYDSTHKLDGNPDVEKYADYSFCSYRKWFYCNCAKAIKHHGTFDNEKQLVRNEHYIRLRDSAALGKKRYFEGLVNEKDSFLAEFHSAEQILNDDYADYVGVPVVFDILEIVSARRENASYLTESLKGIPQLTLWRESLEEHDTPMFVPILTEPEIRGKLRGKLISEQIYCPIHWPRSSYHVMENEIFDTELSLICDQRYDLTDMARIVDAIKDFFNR